jgi:hypothetical protein
MLVPSIECSNITILQKQRGPSLLEIHQYKLQKNPNSEIKSFDRDRDMASTRVNPQSRNRMIQQSKQLNDNFDRGSGHF